MNSMNTLSLGVSEVDITPFGSVETIGFGRKDNRSRGVLHPLSAQICVWQDCRSRCCLVALDHIGFSSVDSDALREKIGKILTVSKEQVMLCFSHTHSAPNESVERRYFASLCGQVEEGVRAAFAAMSPVLTAWGNAYGQIGINRRSKTEASDPRIGVLKVTDAQDGSPRLILLRLTAHANVLKADNYLISPDYFGTVRDDLRRRYGCTVMVTQGASGNVAPKYYCSERTPPDADGACYIRSQTALQDMADEIIRQAEPVLQSLQPRQSSRLEMYSAYTEFHADVPSASRATALAEEARTRARIDGQAWLREVDRLHTAGISVQTECAEIQYFVLDEGCLCGVPNEIMYEFAVEAASLLNNDYFYLGGYTNGCSGYFPTEEEYDQGGYEVYWSMLTYFPYYGRVFPLNRDCAGQLLRTVVENAP